MQSVPVSLIAFTLALSVVSPARAQEPARTDGWVVISVEDYRTLRTKAFPPVVPPDPPPVEAAVTRVEYDLTLQADSVTGTATIVMDVLKDGWVEVVIPPGLLVREARVDGRPVSLVDKPRPHVLLSKRGRSVLTMQVVLPVSVSAAVESVSIPPASAALVQAALQIPRTGVDLSVANGFIAAAVESEGRSRWTAHGRSHEPLVFTWRRRTDDRRAEGPLRLRGSVTQLVALGEDSTQLSATVRVDVVQGAASHVLVAVPSDTAINHVSGPLVADWEVVPGSAHLRVAFLEPVARTTAFTVTAELRASKETQVTVPLLRLADAERETGGVAVEVLGAGEILDRRPQALEPADPSDLGEVVAGRESPSLLAFKFKPLTGREPRALTVQVSRYASQAVLVANVDEARYHALLAEDGKTLVRARYAVRNNRRSFLTVALPQDATLWSASVAGRAVRPGRSSEGALLVPLLKERSRDDMPTFVVEIVYVARVAPLSEKGGAQIALPALDLPVSRTGVVLHHPPRFRVTPAAGAFRLESYVEPFSEVLRTVAFLRPEAVPEPQAPPPAAQDALKDQAAAKLQDLASEFRQKEGRRVSGILPVEIPFVAFGPSVFLASELTPETRPAMLEIEYQRKKGS
jgi:hypothetical protein